MNARAPLPLAPALLLAALATALQAQVTVDWVEPTAGVGIAVDAHGNSYVAYGVQALGAEMVVTKRDVNGAVAWQRSFDQTDPTKWEAATWLATDSQGNAIVTGTLMSGYSNPVKAASIAMKWAPDGTLLWRQVYESSFDGSYTKRCLVDAADNVYVLGMGSGPSGFVTRVKKFAPGGTPLWSWFDGAGIGAPIHFKLTPDAHLVVSGRGLFGSVNGYARLDLDGQTVWSLPGIMSLTIGDVAGDAQGNSYVVHGEYATNGGTQVKKLDPSGKLVWDQSYALSAFRIEVGGDGNPVACGFPNSGQGGAAFIKLDPAGNLLWSNLDADGPSYALLLHAQLLLDEHDDAYLAAGTLFEMAVCKVFGDDGASAWTQTVSGSYANAIALGLHDSSVFVAGGNTARLLDATRSPWVDLGQPLAGAAGLPLLFGDGTLVAGEPMALTLASAAPAAPATLVVGLSEQPAPFKGGVLVPALDLLVGPLVTDAQGLVVLYTLWPAGVPAGTEFSFQHWITDAGATKGLAASNALRGTAP
jgi:hypothetical protein